MMRSFLVLASALSVFSLSVHAADAPAASGDDSIKWAGEFRFRHEFKSQEDATTTPTSFHRDRIMARFGLKAPVNPETGVEIRLATGTGGTSANQTLANGNNYANYSIGLDRAFFDYHGLANTHMYGGRMKNIFWSAGGSDLVFDADLNFDGLAATTEMAAGDMLTAFGNLGFFWINQGSTTSNKDNQQISPQVGLKAKTDSMWGGLSVAQHFYSHTAGQVMATNSSGTATPLGNTTQTNGTKTVFNSDFRIWDAGLEVGTNVQSLPLKVFGNYVTNAAATEEKNGYLFGLKVGTLSNPGDWSLGYDYRQLKKDSVIGAFSDGDSGGGGTDIKSHRIKGSYQVAKNFSGALTGYFGKGNVALAPVRRNEIHLDLTFTF